MIVVGRNMQCAEGGDGDGIGKAMRIPMSARAATHVDCFSRDELVQPGG